MKTLVHAVSHDSKYIVVSLLGSTALVVTVGHDSKYIVFSLLDSTIESV